jgi:hypothetical protein
LLEIKGYEVFRVDTHAVVSSDGKTRTVTFDGTDPQGNKVHNVVVFEKGM